MHGDRVVVRIERYREDGRAEGQIVQVLERAATTVVGRYVVDTLRPRLRDAVRQAADTDIQIPRGETRDAAAGRDGDRRSHALAHADARTGGTDCRGARRHRRSRRRHRDHSPQARHSRRAQSRGHRRGEAHRRRRQGEGHRRPHRLPRPRRGDDRRRTRARLRRCDLDREAEERSLLARRAHRRCRALRPRRRRARSGSRTSAAPRSTSRNAPSTCSRRSWRPGCAASTRTSTAWCSPA